MPARQTISIVTVNFKIASLYLLFKDILNYNTENFVIQKEDLIMAGYKVEICGVNTSKLPMLKDEEKDELFVLIKNGDMEARDKYIKGNLRLVLSIIKRINFIGCNDLRPFGYFRIVSFQFRVDLIDIIDRITSFDTGGIYNMNHNLCTFDMT